MGDGTHKIPLSLYSLNRQRLSSKIPEGSVIVLQGGVDVPFNDTDVDHVFRQVRKTCLCNYLVQKQVHFM